jgi:hypothetical protein
MFRKILIILLVICFLFGMATRKEKENVEKTVETTATMVEEDSELEESILNSGVTGNWTQEEIEYFQKKEYLGNKERYTPYSIEYCPPYLTKGIEISEYGKIGKEDLVDMVKNEKISKEALLRYFSLLRSEIYAREGYAFESTGLKDFFNKMNWYQPKLKEIALTGWEDRNLKVIEELEEIVKNTKVVSKLFAKQIIIKAKWGEGPGEFKLGPLPESYEYITSFTIDVYGNVYIEDPYNQRINVFNKEGKFAKSIPIPGQLRGSFESSLVDGIGTDKDGNIYIASSSTTALLTSGRSGEVVFKIDDKGKILDSLTFKGYYVYPAIFYESDNVMYLWGPWEGGATAGVPLEFWERGKVTELSFTKLRYNSFDHSGKSITLGTRRIKINYDEAPVVFDESKDSRVAFYDGSSMVFQNSDGEIKGTFSRNNFRYYHLGNHGIPYEGHYVIISVWPYIDKDLNIYCIEGTPTHLYVIKCTPTEEIWK